MEAPAHTKNPEAHADVSSRTYKGLQNQGATCYLNSYLQALFHIPYFRNAVFSVDGQSRNNVAFALQHLFFNLLSHSADYHAVNTSLLVKCLEQPPFNWNEEERWVQHDVQEFSCLFAQVPVPKLQTALNKLFSGKLLRHTESSQSTDPFSDISLDVEGSKDLVQSLHKFCCPEEVNGEKTRLTFACLPPVLTFHLKRFSYVEGQAKKLNVSWEFPQTFEFPSECLSEHEATAEPLRYELYAVFTHKGTAQGGHYFVHVRPDIQREKKWWKFDDQTVSESNEEEAITKNFGTGDESAYMLMYVKSSDVPEYFDQEDAITEGVEEAVNTIKPVSKFYVRILTNRGKAILKCIDVDEVQAKVAKLGIPIKNQIFYPLGYGQEIPLSLLHELCPFGLDNQSFFVADREEEEQLLPPISIITEDLASINSLLLENYICIAISAAATNPRSLSCLSGSARAGSFADINEVDDVIGGSLLFWAVVGNNTDLVRELLELGANPNLATKTGETPLHFATIRDKSITEELLKHGADPNVQTQEYSHVQPQGYKFPKSGDSLKVLKTFCNSPTPDTGINFLSQSVAYTSNEYYFRNLRRKADKHSAKDFKFVHTNTPKTATATTVITTTANPGKYTGTVKKESGKAEKIKLVNRRRIWSDLFLLKIKHVNDTMDLTEFKELQEEILKCLYEAIEKGNKDKVIESCVYVLKDPLARLVSKFTGVECPCSWNEDLFNLLNVNLRNLKPKKDIKNFEEQFKHIKAVDRGLDCKRDPRCKEFLPTKFQREILDAIDERQNVIVRSSASSGKTMLSMYLITKMKHEGKTAFYIGANKSVCSEASLFAVNQGLKFSIGNEEFFSVEEMMSSELVICTIRVFLRLLHFADEALFERVGAIVFDEFPVLIHSRRDAIAMSLFTAVSRGWQILTLSATFSDEMKELMCSILTENCKFLEATSSIRPTDLIIHEVVEGKPKKVPVPETYNDTLLFNSQDTLARALRFPATWEDFKETYPRAKATPSFNVDGLLEHRRVVSGVDLTKVCIGFVKHKKKKEAEAGDSLPKEPESESSESESEPYSDSDSDSDSNSGYDSEYGSDTDSSDSYSSDDSKSEPPTSRQIYEMMKTLLNSQKLPALFFHKNRAQLDVYHREISEFLERDYGTIVNGRVVQRSIDAEVAEEKGKVAKAQAESNLAYVNTITSPYGNLGNNNLREFMGYYARKRVKKSEQYSGLSYGIGIYHHAISRSVREAVETGLRIQALQVVMCDTSLSLGLNFPVKSVVFVGGGDSEFDTEEIIQAAGRAGRWGVDATGSIFFMGTEKKTKDIIWDPFKPMVNAFPLSPLNVLLLAVGNQKLRANILDWISINGPGLKVWKWFPETVASEFQHSLNILHYLGTLDNSGGVTHAGKISLSLLDEGPISLLAGGIFHILPNLNTYIQSREDFLYVVTYFLSPWRVCVPGPTLANAQQLFDVSPDLVFLMTHTQKVLKYINFPLSPTHVRFNFGAMPPTHMTALYLSAGNNLQPWREAGNSLSELVSLLAHFLEKIKLFQEVAQLPFGAEVIKELDATLNG